MYTWSVYIDEPDMPGANALQRMYVRYHHAKSLQDLMGAAGFTVTTDPMDPNKPYAKTIIAVCRTITVMHQSQSAMTLFQLRHSKELRSATVTEL
jgi:hypothetical protein